MPFSKYAQRVVDTFRAPLPYAPFADRKFSSCSFPYPYGSSAARVGGMITTAILYILQIGWVGDEISENEVFISHMGACSGLLPGPASWSASD